MKSSKKTGLPKLPKGHSWWVSDHDIRIVKEMPDGEWSESFPGRTIYQDAPNHAGFFYDIEERTELREGLVDSFLFFSKKGLVKVTEYRKVNRRETVWARKYPTKKIPDKWIRDQHGYRVPATKPNETPNDFSNITQRVEEVYRAWKKSEETKALKGLYPPNTMNKES